MTAVPNGRLPLLTYDYLGSQRWPKWIDKESGRRSDPAHHYIYNQAANTNLQLISGVRVVRVLFKYVWCLCCCVKSLY